MSMSIRKSAAVARLNLMLQMKEPSVLLLITIVPIILTPFMVPGNKATLVSEGYIHATGAEQAVPGFAILFSFFSVQLIVQMFFNERHWGTWDRLRASSLSVGDVIVGKAGVAVVLQIAQMGIVLVAGTLICGYRPNGSIAALAITALVFCLALALFGVAVSLWCASEHTALAVAMLLGMLMACIGGSLTPVNTFPAWAQPLARISPAYWVVDAIRRIGLDRGNLFTIMPNLFVIVGFGAVCMAFIIIARLTTYGRAKASSASV
ncbi:MAG: ABC transporter permease [Bifidobacterium psychraerophilum]|uniref:ABC transporter permease n=1 Tax=Bifidobacterium psychraerophilum TaxID=218140 RepID=UPI0039E767AB